MRSAASLLHVVLGAERRSHGSGRPWRRPGPGPPPRGPNTRCTCRPCGRPCEMRGNVEGAALHAIAAADAVLVDEIHDAVRILHDRAGRRAGLEAARIGAMHAAVLADQPFEIVGLRIDPFGEPHQREHVRREVVGVRIGPDVLADSRDGCRSIRRRPTGTPCSRCISKRRSAWRLRSAAAPGGGTVGGRPPDEVGSERLPAIGWTGGIADGSDMVCPSGDAAGGVVGSMLTRNALNSGVSDIRVADERASASSAPSPSWPRP